MCFCCKNSLVKISRIKKCGRNLKPLDKKQAVNAIQYKLDFYRHCKNNPMYKRSTCQPWVVMGKPKITVSGDKNARLICITDDNSIIEPHPCPEDTEIADNKLCQTDNIEPAKIIIRASSETQTDVKCKESNAKTVAKGTQKGKNSLVKISRIKKCGRNLKPLDKKQAVNAIQYKLDFYRHCKNNPMYKRSTTCQPWVLMGKIAEELLNECLLAVAREIEVNDIVERVYQSELQI